MTNYMDAALLSIIPRVIHGTGKGKGKKVSLYVCGQNI